MSYIPNSAMPHARDDGANDARQPIDWQAYADQARELAKQAGDLAGRALGFLRAHPREAAGGAAALVAGVALASWRSSRRSRFEMA